MIAEPIYKTKVLPAVPKVDHIHMDFIMSIGKSDVLYNKMCISNHALHEIVSFWGLSVFRTDEYTGELPAENQLEIADFFKKNPDLDPDCLIMVGTNDVTLSHWDTMRRIRTIEERMEKRRFEVMHSAEMQELHKIQTEIRIKRDPIVLYPENGKQSDGVYMSAPRFAVVTAWGAEEKTLWHKSCGS